jgi:hypothetical protein
MPHDVFGLPFGIMALIFITLGLIIYSNEGDDLQLYRNRIAGRSVVIPGIIFFIVQILQWFKVI